MKLLFQSSSSKVFVLVDFQERSVFLAFVYWPVLRVKLKIKSENVLGSVRERTLPH